MTDSLIRIKASRAGYRRGGLALGPDWQVIDTSSLARAQQLALLADPAVVIEGHDGEDVWSPLSAEIRAGLVSLLEGSEPEGDVVEGDGSGKALAELDPGLLAAAELGRDLESAIADNQGLLGGFDLWPVEDPARLFVVVVDRLADAGIEIERLSAPAEVGSALLAALHARAGHPALADHFPADKVDAERLLNSLLDYIDHPVVTDTRSEEEQQGGGGAAAAPAAAPPVEEPKPAATAGGGAAPKPAPKPKPAAGKKPADSKADA